MPLIASCGYLLSFNLGGRLGQRGVGPLKAVAIGGCYGKPMIRGDEGEGGYGGDEGGRPVRERRGGGKEEVRASFQR
jgi:hypothetical protein